MCEGYLARPPHEDIPPPLYTRFCEVGGRHADDYDPEPMEGHHP